MGFDDLCNTGLVLGLGFPSSPSSAGEIKASKKRQPPPAAAPGIISDQPSLTLSLSGETFATKKAEPVEEINTIKGTFACSDHHSADLYRQDSAASSFSNVSVKREREIACSEDGEITKRNHHHHHHHHKNNSNIVSSRVSDEDDDGSNGRKKLRLSKAQSALLEESFKQHITLNPKQKQDLARELNLRPRQVEVWFQNRRARTKLKQTEVDCELLKKCCETLTDENRRLHKELQELKALKLAQPLYMQLPAATLTMCPSCERLGGGVVQENAAKSAYAMAPKSHFYSPFTNQSAAC